MSQLTANSNKLTSTQATEAPKPAATQTDTLKQRNREAELQAKYPHCQIKPGSLRFHTEGKYKGKNVVILICPLGGPEEFRATSDLFTYKGASKEALKAREKARKAQARVDLNKLQVEIAAGEGAAVS